MQQSARYTLVTAPAEEPITTAEAKAHMNVTTSADDTLIASYIVAARQDAERVMARAIISQTWDVYFDKFENEMYFLKGGVTSITSVKYFDENNSEQTLATTRYSTSRNLNADARDFTRIKIITAPETYSDGIENVVVRFVAGFADAASTPDIIKTAIKVRVATWYETRQEIFTGTQVNRIEGWFESMLQDYTMVQKEI